MRIDNPKVANLQFQEGAEVTDSHFTGSFTGSFTGIGNFTGLTADSVEYDNVLNKPTLISGSDQVVSLLPSGTVSGSVQITGFVASDDAQALGSAANVLTLSSNTLTLTRGDGSTDTVDLSAYLDEDSRSIDSGVLNAGTGIVTYTRDDNSTFTLDLSALLDDTNLVSSVNGAAGVVVLDTDDVAEGSSNQYFTDARAIAALTAGTNVSIAGDGTISSTDTNTQLSDSDVRSKFTAGTNIAIASDGTISSTDTNTQLSDSDVRSKFTAGTNIAIASDGTISSTDTDTQLSTADVRGKFTAGTNVTISDGIISSADTNTQRSDEEIRDVAAAPLTEGSNITIVKNDSADTITISSTDTNTQLSDSEVIEAIVASTSIASGDKTTILSNIGADAAGTDNSTNVTLAGSPDYITISGQTITRNQINLATDVTGTLPVGNMSATALTTVQTAANQTAHLALTAQEGDVVVRTDESKTYMHNGGTAGTMADFTELATPTDSVTSVNGNTGAVTVTDTNTQRSDEDIRDVTAAQLTAGTNVQIVEDDSANTLTISATDTNTQLSTADVRGKFTAGTNVSISNGVISSTDTNTQLSDSDVRSKFTAGANIAITSEGEISSTDTNTQLSDSDIASFGYIKTYTDTNTTYSAGTGLDLSGTTFSIESDLRDSISYIGYDSTDYIQWSNNAWTRTVVNGTERLRVDTSGIDVSGRIVADSDITAYSDERLKKDINTINGALDKTKALRGVEFTRIADDSRSIGVVAQELEAILPELVLTDDEGMKSVNYAQITGLLIEAVKELSNKVDELSK